MQAREPGKKPLLTVEVLRFRDGNGNILSKSSDKKILSYVSCFYLLVRGDSRRIGKSGRKRDGVQKIGDQPEQSNVDGSYVNEDDGSYVISASEGEYDRK